MLEQPSSTQFYENSYEYGYRVGYIKSTVHILRKRRIRMLREAKKHERNPEQMSEYEDLEKDIPTLVLRVFLEDDPDLQEELQDLYGFLEKYPRLDDKKLVQKIMAESEYLHVS